MPSNVTPLGTNYVRTPDDRQASILLGKAKKARDHAMLLYLAMLGCEKMNGLDWHEDMLTGAVGDLQSELARLVSEMDGDHA